MASALTLALVVVVGPAYAATTVDGTTLQFQGGVAGATELINFDSGGSQIYDDWNLHIVTDDALYLDAPTMTYASGDVTVQGNDLIFAGGGWGGGNQPTVNFNQGSSQIYDNADLHVVTDDDLYLDAPTVTIGNGRSAGWTEQLSFGSTGSSRIYDAWDLYIATDDNLYLDPGSEVRADAHVNPVVDDSYDLGSATMQWRNLYVDGTAEVDALSLNGTAVTSTAAELNALDGITATVTELNYTDGVTSAIQTQLDAKADIAGAENVSGVWEIQDNTDFAFGNDGDVVFLYDETTDDRLEVVDSADNVLMTIADAGTTGNVTISGDLTVTGTVSGSVDATGTSNASFELDDDQGADADVTLQFGNTSAETLIWDQSEAAFALSDDLIPAADDTSDLGDATNEWQDAFFDGTVTLDTLVVSTTNGEGVGSAILPTTDDSYDLGSSTYEWQDIYVDGVAYVDAIGSTTDEVPSNVYLADSSVLYFGDAQDAYGRWDGTDFDWLPAADDSVMKFGDGTNNFDVWFYGDTSNDNVIFDASGKTWAYDGVDVYLEDSDVLAFGDGQDVQARWDGTDFDVLAAADDSAITFGVAGGNAFDVTLSGDAAGETVVWDASEATLDVASAIGGTTADNVFQVTLTNSSTSGNQYGAYLDNAASTGTTEALLVVDNSDGDTALTDGVLFVDAGGGTTDAIDASATDITNALNVGANTITGTTAVVDFTDFDVSADGLVTLAPDGAGDAISQTLPNADTQALVVDASTAANTATDGLIDLNIATITDGFEAVNIDLNVSDDAGSDTVMGVYLNIDDNATTAADTVYGIYVDNEDGVAGADALVYLDNSDTDTAVADGIFFNSEAGAITDAIDASDAQITNALNVGANTITGAAAVIDFTEFDVSAAGAITVGDGEGLDTNAAGALDLGITNATSVSVGTDLLTDADSTNDIGATATRWSTIYADTYNYSTAVTDANAGNTTVTLGDSNSLDTVTITANTAIDDAQWSVTAAGAATLASAVIDNSTYDADKIDSSGTFEINTDDAADADITLDAGTQQVIVAATGGAEGTDALTVNVGDVTLTDGDLNVSGGEAAVTTTSTTARGLTLTQNADLGAGVDAMQITSTGNISSTSNLLSIEQSTGAGTAGAYGLYISTTGTNVEALKVDDGTATFDEAVYADGGVDRSSAAALAIGATNANAVTITPATTVNNTVTVGSDGVGHTVTFYSDTAGDTMVWDDTAGSIELTITGTNAVDALVVADGNVNFTNADDVTFPAGTVSAADIANPVRVIQVPLTAWRVDANPHTDITGATTPNVSAEGNFDTIEWGNGETTQKVTYTFVMPDDYASATEFHALEAHDAAAATTDDTLGLDWYNAKNGEADNPTVVDEGVTTFTEAETLTEVTIAMDGGTLEANDVVRLVFGWEALDQTAHIAATWIEYTATM